MSYLKVMAKELVKSHPRIMEYGLEFLQMGVNRQYDLDLSMEDVKKLSKFITIEKLRGENNGCTDMS